MASETAGLCHLVENFFFCPLTAPQGNPRLVRAAHRSLVHRLSVLEGGTQGVPRLAAPTPRMCSSPVPFSQPGLGRLLLPPGAALQIQWEAIAMATGLGPGFTSSNSKLKPKRLRN